MTVGQPAPERPALPMATDKRKLLPPSSQGGTSVGQPGAERKLLPPRGKTKTGKILSQSQKDTQSAMQNRKLKNRLDSMNENLFDWRKDFIFEVDEKNVDQLVFT